MLASCWLALGSPNLPPLSNSLKAFDGHTFVPKGYLAIFPITLAGKTVTVDVEVVDRKLDYNLLLGHSWTYAMTAIISTVFCIIQFPLDGKVIIVDQFSFYTPDYSPLPSGSVPLVRGGTDSYVSLGTNLLKASYLMGYFPLQPLKVSESFNMLSSFPHEQTNPWILSAPSNIDTYGEQILLSPAELVCEAI